jgi:hypothetical protein
VFPMKMTPNGRRPQILKMEDDLKKDYKWKTSSNKKWKMTSNKKWKMTSEK